ncbi:NAD(P)/FAD-dependent oxidoreductase [Maricurvus nonylphenolicus]|uniref:flavin-containing monooxygenase n=1 Tax=Maricurvus nonylphenolicus TaxID=1008307 RepID=UPI0036F2ED6F
MTTQKKYDVLVIGAGLNGLYAIQKLKDTNLSYRCVERNADLGGTWYKNRYPGCTLDSETLTYQFSFSNELVDEYSWERRFSIQPELLEYINHAAEKFDWRDHIDFDVHIKNSIWDEEESCWTLSDENGENEYKARYVIFATGPLSEPLYPDYPGRDDFEGLQGHSINWDERFDDLTGKRVAVIGTGATAIQIITEVAKKDCQLSVFQRNPDWATPLGNGQLTDEEKARYKGEAAQENFTKLHNSFAGFEHNFIMEGSFLELSPEEQKAHLEEKYYAPGFSLWLGSYADVIMDPETNKVVSEFIADKVRSRVDDPVIAEKLIPKNHGFGLKRVPQESGYYESYNRPNVELVDLLETPITRFTPKGIETTEKEHEFDVIVYGTGFNAFVGPFESINIVGKGGVSLKEYWEDGVKSYLGMSPHGFPNTFMPLGPLNGGTLCNFPRCIETNTDWVIKCILAAEEKGCTQINARKESEAEWVNTVAEVASTLLMSTVDSWFNGQNTDHRPNQFLAYFGGSPNYQLRLEDEVETDYSGFEMT